MSQNNFLENIFIIDGARTAVGRTFKGLKEFTAPHLAAAVIKEILPRHRFKADLIDEVILGHTVSAGTGQNVARQAGILAGLPAGVPGLTINNVCGSGLQSVILAARAIACNDAKIVIAGGAESSSHYPLIVRRDAKEPKTEEDFIDSLIHDGLTCLLANRHMGELAELTAEQFKISRKEQDQYSLESHAKALKAQENEKFSKEIVPVKTIDNKIIAKDERPRKNIDLEKLANLGPAFKKNGTVTAGNSSIPSDGAAILLLADKKVAEQYQLRPKARILGYASVAVEPKMVFTACAVSVRECLKKSGLSLKDIDLFEIGEAFAVQAILTQREQKIPAEKMNIFGGDVALGHPLGAAGARILVTLLHALHDQKKKRGLTSVCLGGGGAVALAVETAA